LPDPWFAAKIDPSLTKLVKFCWLEGLHQGTRKSYGLALKDYLAFCTEHGLRNHVAAWFGGPSAALHGKNAPFPGEAELMWFAGWLLWRRKLQPATIMGKMTGLASELSAMGKPDCMVDPGGAPHKKLHRLPRGMKRNYTKKPKTRKPLTIDKVKLINDFCDARRDLSEMDKATLTAAWTGGVRLMLRIGEITTEKNHEFDASLKPTLLDVDLDHLDYRLATFAELDVKASKTDYYRKGVTLRCAADGSSTCAVRRLGRMKAMRLARGAAQTDALFRMDDGSYLTRKRLQKEMRSCLKAVGLVPGHYSSHSLRIGGATTLAACKEMDSDRIRVLGRWASDCFLRYMRQTDTMLKDVARAMGAMADVDFRLLGKKAFDPWTAG